MKRRGLQYLLGFLLVPTLFVLAGCGEETTVGVDGGQSSLSLQLTDAPSADLDSAWVGIQEIRLQGDDEDENGEGGENGEAMGGQVLFSGSTDLINLTDLADETLSLVEDVPVESGTYGQLRIILGAAAVQTEDGDVFSRQGAAQALGKTATGQLQCPSCSQTGLKVLLPGGSLELQDEAKILVLDFDVSQSFGRQAGMSGMWVMHPVIQTSELSTSGSIEGAVASNVEIPECPAGTARGVEDFVPTATGPDAAEMIKTATVNPDSSFTFSFLAPGDWAMGFEENVEAGGSTLVFDAMVNPQTVSVSSGQSGTVDYTITTATCQASGN